MLSEIVTDQIWCQQSPVRFGPLKFKSRMTVVRLPGGRLLVHSPIRPLPNVQQELARIGSIAYVVAPNKNHHRNFEAFANTYPEAEGYIAPGLNSERPELARYQPLDCAQPWQPDLKAYFISGLPVLNETVFYHPGSSTLIVTDLLFFFGSGNSILMTLAASLLGVRGRLAMSRTMKMMVKDKSQFMQSVEPLLSLPLERIILGHDSIIEHSARSRLMEAFSWLD